MFSQTMRLGLVLLSLGLLAACDLIGEKNNGETEILILDPQDSTTLADSTLILFTIQVSKTTPVAGESLELRIEPADSVESVTWAGPPSSTTSKTDTIISIPRGATGSLEFSAKILSVSGYNYAVGVSVNIANDDLDLIPEKVDNPLADNMVYFPAGVVQNSFHNYREIGFSLDTQFVLVDEFYLGKEEVSQMEFESIMGFNPSFHVGEDLPVESVTWEEAIEYCNRKSLALGLNPVYYGEERFPRYEVGGVRLATTFEWQRAAESGFREDGCPEDGGTANFVTKKIHSFPADKNGIRGLQENVGEWVYDMDGKLAEEPFLVNPEIENVYTSNGRVFRGRPGNLSINYNCRHFVLNDDNYLYDTTRSSLVGFRIAFGQRKVREPIPVINSLSLDSSKLSLDSMIVSLEYLKQGETSIDWMVSIDGDTSYFQGGDTLTFNMNSNYLSKQYRIRAIVYNDHGSDTLSTFFRYERNRNTDYGSQLSVNIGEKNRNHWVNSEFDLNAAGFSEGSYVVLYEWNLGPGGAFIEVSEGDTTVITPPDTGTIHEYIIRVTDNLGDTLRDTLTVRLYQKWEVVLAEAPFGRRVNHTVTSFQGKLWLIGGALRNNAYSDIWSSENGADWVLVTDSAHFGPRQHHATVVFQNKLWVIGGGEDYYQAATYTNSIWVSEDGENWNLAEDSAAFSPRIGHSVTEHNGELWLIGGQKWGSDHDNEVYKSSDGIQWTLVTQLEYGSPINREDMTFCSLQGYLWVLGGKHVENYVVRTIQTTGSSWENGDFPAAWGEPVSGVNTGFCGEGEIWIHSQSKIISINESGTVHRWATHFNLPGAAIIRFDDKIWFFGGVDIGTYSYNRYYPFMGDVMYLVE